MRYKKSDYINRRCSCGAYQRGIPPTPDVRALADHVWYRAHVGVEGHRPVDLTKAHETTQPDLFATQEATE